MDGGNPGADARGRLFATLGVEGRDNLVILIPAHHGRDECQQHQRDDNHQPEHGALVAHKMNSHALPVTLGGVICIGGDIFLLQQLEIAWDRHIFHRLRCGDQLGLFHSFAPPLADTRMRGSSAP